jgi:hypothetical protein
VSNINTEPPGLGDAGHEPVQERHALAYHWPVRSGGRGADLIPQAFGDLETTVLVGEQAPHSAGVRQQL